MEYDFARLDATVANQLMTALVVPRPIAWVVTVDGVGRRNAAPFSFFNVLCSWPPIVALGVQPRPDGTLKDTRANIELSGEFVINLVPHGAVDAMNLTSGAFPSEVDELAMAKLETIASTHVQPPRIAASPAALECRLRQTVPIAEGRAILLGDVLSAHVDDAALIDRARGQVDASRLDLVARMHGRGMYLRTLDLFQMTRPAEEITQ